MVCVRGKDVIPLNHNVSVYVCVCFVLLCVGVDYLGLPRWANNRFDLDSAIYRFNVVSQRFEQFQLIATTGATEMLFFSFDGIDFLFIVNNRNAGQNIKRGKEKKDVCVLIINPICD